MDNYVCFKCGHQTEAIKGLTLFCQKCKRKMFNLKKLNNKLEDSLIGGILFSLNEQFRWYQHITS